jgi:hypothetical protein
MLVVLTGTESTKKYALATSLTLALNSFNAYKIGDYSVDFTKPIFEIKDKDGTVVYDGEIHSILHNADGSASAAGLAVFTQANEFMSALDAKIKSFFYKTEFSSFAYDYGMEPAVDFMNDYPAFMEKYQSRPFDVAVAVGAFSKAFIDKVISDLGSDNVKVVSIVRSPSVAYMLNTISPAEIEYRHIDESPIGVKYATEDFFTAYMDAFKLKDLSYVNTVRFEDMAVAGKIKVGDVEVTLPSSFDMHNWLLTKQEFAAKDRVYTTEIDEFNTKANSLKTSIVTTENISNFPDSLFTPLNYVPLAFNTVFQ